MFNKLTDKRNQSYVTYQMKKICVTRLFGLLCGITSMTDISSDDFNTDCCINNLSIICGQDLEELPYWETIQDVFQNIYIEELRSIQKYIVKALVRFKMLDKYRFNGCFQLLFDGNGLSNYNLNGNCLQRKHKDGKISYYKYVLKCKLVVGSIVISLDTEFVENNNMLPDKQKQDCETNAFKRMVKRIKMNYPKYKFIVTGDALYATSPIINVCKKYEWNYIFNLKPDRLKEIVNLGRRRWKIENKGFYNQKHRIFDITHLNSRNDNAMKVHYFFIQFAHTIWQLLEQGNILTKSLKLKIKEVSQILLKTLTSFTNTNLNNINYEFQLRFDT